MYAIEQIKEYLKPEGRLVLSNLKKEIIMIGEQVQDNEIVENAGIVVRGLGGLKQYLAVLTSSRLLTTDKRKSFISYDLDKFCNIKFNKKLTTTEMSFIYNSEEHTLSFNNVDLSLSFLAEIKNSLGVLPTVQEETEKRKIVRVMKPIKLNIEILNGKEQLRDQGSSFKLLQTKPGTIEISVNNQSPETFQLIKWERVENIQKSAFDIAGWSLIGSTFGNAGSIAGAMGANIGKDKSVATLFLKRENNEKVPLVIKCDKKDLEKLSLLIVADETEEATQVDVALTTTPIIPTDELIKLKELLDVGILTQEEFDTKKKQLLGI
ncbi:SHOCT domain-containing protein [Lysinibacillus xylanilyticus]|uniref:SHOCT domain-containing protein n=1 Tax=Lysinibacillus xylanilyticus TaxID=582475 RepID=UPI002B255B69|nr:SHOCT domain-containing protein [Lysinibacillus xylanilyticus]MEB2279645.1 SHOCT domain-containing protein [Lysinibacillus xylanilyticus]